MLRRKGVHPGRQKEVQLLHGELVEHRPEDGRHVLVRQCQAVHRHAVDAAAPGDLPGDGLGPLRPGLLAVQKDDEGFSKLLKLPDDPFLRFPVVLPGNAGDAAVSGDDDADGGVLPDDLPGTGLRRLRHGDLMVKPGGGHHPGGVPLQLAHGPGDHVAHAVDEPNGEGRASLQRHVGGLLRHELGLRRHDGAAGAALGQLIPGPLPAVDVVDVGDDLRLHETLDEGGLPGPHRAHDADVNVARRPCGDALIDGCVCHSIPSLSALHADAVSYVPGRASMPPPCTVRPPLKYHCLKFTISFCVFQHHSAKFPLYSYLISVVKY